MNKKIQTLLSAGLVTVLVGVNVATSGAVSKNLELNTNTKSTESIKVKGVKYKRPSGNNCGSNNNSNSSNNSSSSNEDNNINAGNSINDKNVSNGDFSEFQQEVLKLVNVERTKRGLTPLKINTKLSNVATLKSQDMIDNNYFSHTSPRYGSPFDMMKQFGINYTAAAENIAKGQKTPQQVVNSWMNSSGHRANILSSKYTDLGVGIAKSSNGTIYWTQMFIKPSRDTSTDNSNNNNTGNNNVNNNTNNNTNNNINNDNINNGNTSNDNNTSNNGNTTTESFASFQQEVLKLVNAERAKQGLKPLTLNTKLSNVATLKSQDMINKNYFSHTSPTYGSPFDMMKQFGITYRAAGENIAKGQKSPQQVMNSWMNSSGHRANILNSNYTELGVGIAKSSNGTIYWTQMFIGR